MEKLMDGRGYRRVLEREISRPRVGIVTKALIETEERVAPTYFLTAVGDPTLDFAEYTGAPLADAVAAVGGREVFTFPVEDIDSFREEGLLANQFHQETALWRSKLPDSAQPPAHFLVSVFEGRLAKFLPSAFGVLLVFTTPANAAPAANGPGVTIEDETEQHDLPRTFFLGFRRGRLEFFYEPEVESLVSPVDARNRVSVDSSAKQLATKHAMPVQAMVLCPREWREWQGMEPRMARRRLASSLRAGRAQLVPFKLLLSSAIFLKGL